MKARDLIVFLKGDKSHYSKTLAAADKERESFVSRWGSGLKRLGVAMTGFGTVGTGAVVAITKSYADSADQLQKMRDRTGISVQSLSELQHAANLSGSSILELDSSLKRMAKTIYDASKGSKMAVDGLGDLGLRVEDLKDKSPEEQFNLMASRLADVRDESKRAAIAMTVFGRSGQKMLPMLSGGAKGLADMRREARELGITMSDEDADAAAEMNDNIQRLGDVLRSLRMWIARMVVPILSHFAIKAKEVVMQLKVWLNEHDLLRTALAKLIVLGPPLLVMLGGILLLLPALTSGFSIAAGVIGGTLLPALMPLIVIGGALFALWKSGMIDWGELWTWLQGKIESFAPVFGRLKEAAATAWQSIQSVVIRTATAIYNAVAAWVEQNRERISAFWQSVKDAAVGAWAVIWSSMQQAWQGITAFWTQIQPLVMQVLSIIWHFIQVTLENIMAFWHKHHETIKAIALAVWMTIEDIVRTTWGGIKWFIDTALKAFTGDWEGAWDNVAGVFRRVWTGIKDFFRGIITSIAEAWDSFIDGIINKFEALILKIPFVDSIQTFAAQTAAKIPAFADGGFAPRKGLFMVGEEGPEILNAANGRIFSNRDLQHLNTNNSNSFSITINTTGGVSEQDARNLAGVIRRELNRGKY